MRSQRRARFALMSTLGIIILTHLGLNIALETSHPELRDPDYGNRLHLLKKLTQANPDHHLLIALGSSRTQMGLSPSDMSPVRSADGTPVIVFNYGLAGCGPLQELLCFHRLLDAGVRPDYLLVEVLPPALHQDADGAEFVHLSRLSFDDLAILGPYCRRPKELRRDWWELRLSPWTAVRFALLSRLMPGWVPTESRVDYLWTMVDEYGWMPYPREEVSSQQRQKSVEHARREYRAHLTNFHISPIPDRSIRELISLCRREGIPLAFYRMPEGDRFRGWYSSDAHTCIDRYFDTLSEQYRIPIFDTSAWLPEDNFFDSHHLLPIGGRVFSKRFAEEVIIPWVYSSPPPPR